MKEAKNREFFEKIFPKLRKQREDRERFNRVGARVKSDADLEEIMDGLQEQEMEDKKMRSYAVVPPLLLDARQRTVFYINNNGRLDDFGADYKERQLLNVWTQSEKEIFKEKFLQHPKNFSVIASYLERKSVCDCVQYYYLSKKTENYKRLLRKSRQRTRSGRGPQAKVAASGGGSANSVAVTTNSVDSILAQTAGVTTRLQREQLQKQETPQPVSTIQENTNNNNRETNADNPAATSTSFLLEQQNQQQGTLSTTLNSSTVPQTTGSITVTASAVTTVTTMSANAVLSTTAMAEPSPSPANITSSIQSQVSTSQPSTTSVPFTNSDLNAHDKNVEERKSEKRDKDEMETTDDDNFEAAGSGDAENIIGVACAVCKSESSCSRALPRSQASQYGLREDEISADARVCNLCRCKAVRSRFTNCPIPTCPNARGHRVKRLRQLPSKWIDLPPHIRDPIAMEFQIDRNITKCCSACYNRIMRRISVVSEPDTASSSATLVVATQAESTVVSAAGGSGSSTTGSCTASGTTSNLISGRPISNNAHSPLSVLETTWTDEEISNLRKGLQIHGTRWSDIAPMVGVGTTKTPHQCMNFYYTNNKKYGLDQIIQKKKQGGFPDRKPMLTDEEESGSSTSSCDETETGVVGADSDTTSAPSPSQHASGLSTLLQNDDQPRVLPGMTPPPKLTEEGRDVILDSQDHSPVCKVPTPSMPPLLHAKEDYDSSATETADEGQGAGDNERDTGITHLNQVPASSPGPTPKDRTVKDLMLEVIEMQLKKDQGPGSGVGPTGVAPTISSILKSEHGIFRDRTDNKTRQESNLATVSVVSSHHSHQAHQDFSPAKDGIVVVQVGQGSREPEGVTLDLSIKKPRENLTTVQATKSSLASHQHSSQGPHNSFRVTQSSSEQAYFHQQQVLPSQLTSKLSPGVINATNCSAPVSKAVQQTGSIIHGTPVSSPNIYSQARYEAATLHHSSPHKETGSITQGTPVHQRNTLYANTEYYNKRSSHPQTATFYPPARAPAYSVEQRQIIMNDYITSQQMHGGAGQGGSQRSSNRNNPGVGASNNDKVFSAYSTARQGVIQRHTAQRPPSPPAQVTGYPPGHEAFSSLVDVAVRQPSLPVPPQVSIQEDKRRIHEGLGERFPREAPHDRYVNRDPVETRYMKDSSKSLSQLSQSRSEHQPQQSLIQLRDQMHSTREAYTHHIDSHQAAQMQQMREREAVAQQQKLHMHIQHAQQAAQHVQQVAQQVAAAAQQRQISSYQQRMMHESGHHSLDQRLMSGSGFREQPITIQQQPHTIRHAAQDQCGESVSRQAVRGGESSSTLTAASLIDAIITHQINQSSESQTSNVQSGTTSSAPQSQTRPGDRLFQGFHRECTESNGKLSPIKLNMNIENKMSHSQGGSSGPPIITQEHVDLYSRGLYQGYDQGQTWKLRRALQTKEEYGGVTESPVPLSPLDYVKNRIAEVMRTSEEDGSSGSVVGGPKTLDNESSPSSHLSGPSEHGSASVVEQQQQQQQQQQSVSGAATMPSAPPPQTFLPPATHYAYPYSALSLGAAAVSGGSVGGAGSAAGAAAGVPPQSNNILQPSMSKPAESIPEPAPLLSAQYEPLSDED